MNWLNGCVFEPWLMQNKVPLLKLFLA